MKKFPTRVWSFVMMMTLTSLATMMAVSAAFAAANELPVQGPADAEVTVVEFADFQCPYCARAVSSVDRLLAESDGHVRVIFRNFPWPFHENAESAARAGYCAQRAGSFWKMHALLFQNQDRLGEAAYLDFARQSGIDPAAFAECLVSSAARQAVQADIVEGQRLGINGTPTFLFSSRTRTARIAGAQDFGRFKALVDDLLAHP